MTDKKDPSITFSAREWAMHEAGVTQGMAAGMKATASQLRQSLAQSVEIARAQVKKAKTKKAASDLKAFEVWVGGLQPWMDAVLKDAEKRLLIADSQVRQIGPVSRNLRNRIVNAIMTGVSEFKKG